MRKNVGVSVQEVVLVENLKMRFVILTNAMTGINVRDGVIGVTIQVSAFRSLIWLKENRLQLCYTNFCDF